MSQDDKKEQFNREADGLIYRTATPADTEAVWQLMTTQFFPRIAICQCLKMDQPEDVELAHGFMLNCMKEGLSLIVVDSASKQVIGARLSSIELQEDGNEKQSVVADSVIATKYQKNSIMLRMFFELTSSIDIFVRYNVSRTLAFKFLVVSESHAGRGIAKKLVQFSLEVAKDFNLELVTACTTSRYSERIYESLGFDRLNVLHLPDFVDPVTGGKPFAKLDTEALKDSVLYSIRI